MYGYNANNPSSDYMPVINSDLNEAVPPYALMQPFDDPVHGALVIGRPDGSTADLLVNSLTAIPRQEEDTTDNNGSGHRTFPAVVAYQNDNPGGLAPQVGEEWGPRPGSWYLHKGERGFRVLGGGANGLVNVIPTYAQEPRRVQLLTPLQPCGSAQAIEMDYINGTYCNFGDRLIVYDSASVVQTELDPGIWLWATFQPDSLRWEVESVGSFGCCGGSGSGSGSMSACITNIGGTDFSKLPLADPDGGTILLLAVQDGCLVLVPTTQCPSSGSGSGS